MINKLERVVVEEDEFGAYSRVPNNLEMMDKLNEIIDYVNKLDENIGGLSNLIVRNRLEKLLKLSK